MKTLGIFLFIFLVGVQTSFSQKTTSKERKEQKAAEIKQLVESGDFVFIARFANPMSGPKIDLTSVYDLKFKVDSVEAWLPYYGRAYQAPYADRDGGIKFNAKVDQIETTFSERKKSYQINFEVKDQRDTYKMNLLVGLGGYGNLNVNMNHRQSISFSGIVEGLQKE